MATNWSCDAFIHTSSSSRRLGRTGKRPIQPEPGTEARRSPGIAAKFSNVRVNGFRSSPNSFRSSAKPRRGQAWLQIQQAPSDYEAAPPLPPEVDTAEPPLPTEDDAPPLPPPDGGDSERPSPVQSQPSAPGYDAAWEARVESGLAPWQQHGGHAQWQNSVPLEQGAEPIQQPQGQLTEGQTLQGLPSQSGNAYSHTQASASYNPWQQSWSSQPYNGQNHQPYGAAVQPGYSEYYSQPPNAYQGYSGYGQPGYPTDAYASQSGGWDQQSAAIAQAPWNQPAMVPDQPPIPAPMVKNEVDAEDLFLRPGRDRRPKKLAILLRGLPGSGKSHIAKKLREVEIENGGEAPRIHAIDDYFVTEVEKEVEEQEAGKKPRKKTITTMEYLYESDLEDSYKASILKAFTKTVEEGRFPFVILDAPNILIEDFRPFHTAAQGTLVIGTVNNVLAAAEESCFASFSSTTKGVALQRTGYEVFVLKPLETDPEACFKRNVHQREADTIADLAGLYEPTPKIYAQLLVDSLFDLPKPPKEESSEEIEEVDMEDDKDDAAKAEGPKVTSRWAALEDEAEAEEENPKRKRRKREAAKDTSHDPEAQNASNGKAAPVKGRPSILRKPGFASVGKSVRWADEAPQGDGFSISTPSQQQLAVVHYMEGLGPEPDVHSHGSFQEHARADRKSEGKTFRDILLGGGA